MTIGAVSVGAAIFGPEDRVVGAVSIVVADKGREPGGVAPAVRAVANGLTRRVVTLWDRVDVDPPMARWSVHRVDIALSP